MLSQFSLSLLLNFTFKNVEGKLWSRSLMGGTILYSCVSSFTLIPQSVNELKDRN